MRIEIGAIGTGPVSGGCESGGRSGEAWEVPWSVAGDA